MASTLHMRGQSAGRRYNRAIHLLVASQVALTMVLLVSTGLLVKSAVHVAAIAPGFDSRNVLTMTISLPVNKFEFRHNTVFSRDVINAVKTNPAVTNAAVIQGVPMRPGGFRTSFIAEGMPASDFGDLPVALQRVVSPDYFGVMGIPLLDGRNFDDRDGSGELGRPPFVLVNHALAARCWPGESAVGKRLHAGVSAARPDGVASVTVGGVVGDVRYAGLEIPPDFEIYLPERLFPQSAITLLVKTTANPLRIVADLRDRIARVDREAFVTDVRTMDGMIADSLASRSFATVLLAVCAAIGLLLALIGIFGTVAQTVVQRRFEIGVRLALGATPQRVVRQMLQFSIAPVAAGAVVGLGAMIVVAQLLSAMLFETHPFDIATFVAAAALFASVALVAAYLPARRVTEVSPLSILKCE